MGRQTQLDWVLVMERMFLDAAATLRWLPQTGTLPSTFRSCTPEPLRDRRDWGPHTAESQRERNRSLRTATSAAIDRLDRALHLISGASLTAEERNLVWGRAFGAPWKALANEFGSSVATLKRRNRAALAEIAEFDALIRYKAVTHNRRGGHEPKSRGSGRRGGNLANGVGDAEITSASAAQLGAPRHRHS